MGQSRFNILNMFTNSEINTGFAKSGYDEAYTVVISEFVNILMVNKFMVLFLFLKLFVSKYYII